MDTLQKTLKNLPHTPGVYLYRDETDTVIYVGKARDLFTRVHQYFVDPKNLPEKTRALREHIHSIRVKQVSTEFEAILLEAKLIRFYNPKYNSIAKDDKSPIYIKIQKTGTLPILTVDRKPKVQLPPDGEYFGPFASKKIAMKLLHTLRHSIPFCQQKIQNGKPCFYSHLGLCDPCPSAMKTMPMGIEKKFSIARYKKNITRLRWVLSGKTKQTVQSMQKEMIALSKREQFEKAGMIRDQMQSLITSLNNTYDPFVFEATDQLERNPIEQTQQLAYLLQPYYPMIHDLERIECYDMSTLHGLHSVGSLVVFLNGIPHTNEYRRFKIKNSSNTSDTDMMGEVLYRRLNHPEWDTPELIVVDGGKGQVSKVHAILRERNLSIPLIGLAKRFEQIIIPTDNGFQTLTVPLNNRGIQLLQHIRDEAHRFAHSYNQKLRKNAFAQSLPSLI
jgi:excinuclease ABC subunit C